MKLHLRQVATALALAGFTIGTASAEVCSPNTMSLVAGQHNYAGTVSITYEDGRICATYATDGGWLLTETHLSIETSLAAIPQTGSGNPKPGQFTYKTTHKPPVTTFTYCTQRGLPSGEEIFIAAHAVVQKGSQRETAWAGDLDFPGANWATYFTVTCEGGPQDS